MNAKRGQLGTKAQIRASREKQRRIGLVVTVTILITIIVISGFMLYTTFFAPSPQATLPSPTHIFLPSQQNQQRRAVIVDQLDVSFPNETFVNRIADILTSEGYTVDYYDYHNVTVEFYRNLPLGNYSIMMLRSHMALAVSTTKGELSFVDLFTAEPYSLTKYVPEQLSDQISKCVMLEGGPSYFGVSPPFIRNSIIGKFRDTTVIAMGCDGLTYKSMAEAFISKGAKAYIGWNGSVGVSHTDVGTTYLLKKLVTEENTIKQAITDTMKVIGPDPGQNSILEFYPLSAGDQKT